MKDIGSLFQGRWDEKDSQCLLVLVACLALAACGKRGAPLPPLQRIPAAIADLTASRFGEDVFVRFKVPTTNVDGQGPADVTRVELYAISADHPPASPIDLEELRAQSTLVATEQVRRPIPPPPKPKPGAPEPPPLPLQPGVDQGAEIVVRERLTPEARTPVVLKEPKKPKEAVPADPIPGPLTYVDKGGPRRYYYAVAVSPQRRYGPMSGLVPVPLGLTASATSAPTVTNDETSLKIAWTPPPDAKVLDAPSDPALLPSRPIVPGPSPTLYEVHEVPREGPPTNASPTMPAAVAPEGGALELSIPVGTFGVERCFVVYPVDVVDEIHARGPVSDMTCFTPVDKFPPEAPKSLAAVATSGMISLIWEPNEESDLAGYLVLRGEAPGATLAPQTPEPIRATSYRDTDVKPGVRYVYAVVAVDTSANQSAESERREETAR